MKFKKICFYEDFYDNNDLVWKANTHYPITYADDEKDVILCKDENGGESGISLSLLKQNLYFVI